MNFVRRYLPTAVRYALIRILHSSSQALESAAHALLLQGEDI